MADAPEIAEAKAKLRGLVVTAVDSLEDLMGSEHDGIRLGAAKEVLDRGGVPAKHDHNVTVEIGIDEEIEELIGSVRRQVEGKKTADEYLNGIEDAIVVDENGDEVSQLEPGEEAARYIGVPRDEVIEDAEEVEAPARAWWQANPT